MDLVEDTCQILDSSHIFNAEDYNSFLTAIKENSGLNKLLQEYCSLMQQSELSDCDANRVLEIVKLAEYDDLLSQCVSKIDESLEIINEVNPKSLSITDFISKVKATPKQKMTEELFLNLVQQIKLSSDFLSSYIEFKQEKYNRQVILSTPELCIYVICWKPGHETMIHQHEYSFGNALVCQGILTSIEYEETYTFGRKSLKTTSHRYYSQDQWLSVSLNKFHQLSNRAPHDLITLHFKYFVTDPLERQFKTPRCTKRDRNPELYDYKSFQTA